MHDVNLKGLRVAVLATDGFEQIELTHPVEALEEHGAEVDIVSLRPGRIRGVNHMYPGKKVRVDRTVYTADAGEYDALLLPGGLINPDTLRQNDRALDFVRAMDHAGKPIAVICHAPWLLISGGLIVRRSLTSWPGIRDDVRNAGGVWSDEPVVRDRNWVSSRGPQDIDDFTHAMLNLFAEHVRITPRPSEAEHAKEGGLPIGRMLLGGLAAAGIAYLVRNQLAREEQPLEYVEVVDLEPDVVIIEDAYPPDDYESEGAYAGGMPYRSGTEYSAGTGAGYTESTGYTGAAGTGYGAAGGTADLGGTGTGYGATPGSVAGAPDVSGTGAGYVSPPDFNGPTGTAGTDEGDLTRGAGTTYRPPSV
jgi:protease I